MRTSEVHTSRRRAAAAGVLALVVLGAGPAQAATERHADPAHDVVYVIAPDFENPHPDRTDRDVDVTALTTRYGHDALALTVHVRRLDPHLQTATAQVDGPRGARFRVEESDTGPLYDYTTLERLEGDVYRVVACPGLQRVVDTRADTLRLVVPAGCLDGVAWVRTGLTFGTYDAKTGRSFYDDARTTGDDGDHRIAVGPRVGRG